MCGHTFNALLGVGRKRATRQRDKTGDTTHELSQHERKPERPTG
jgi:hypothetical protein